MALLATYAGIQSISIRMQGLSIRILCGSDTLIRLATPVGQTFLIADRVLVLFAICEFPPEGLSIDCVPSPRRCMILRARSHLNLLLGRWPLLESILREVRGYEHRSFVRCQQYDICLVAGVGLFGDFFVRELVCLHIGADELLLEGDFLEHMRRLIVSFFF